MNDDFDKQNPEISDKNEDYEYPSVPAVQSDFEKVYSSDNNKVKPETNTDVFADKKMKTFLTASVIILLFLVVSLVVLGNTTNRKQVRKDSILFVQA